MKRETFSRAAERVSEALQEPAQQRYHDPYACASNGCPLFGSIGEAGGRAQQRWCRFHFGEFGVRADRITNRLRMNSDIVDESKTARRMLASGERIPDDTSERLMAAESSLSRLVNEVLHTE